MRSLGYKDLKKEIAYIQSQGFSDETSGMTSTEIENKLPFRNAEPYLFTQAGRSYSIPLLMDVNAKESWAITWRCTSVKCWFRPKYRPSKSTTRAQKVTLDYISGFMKGRLYNGETLNPSNSIQLSANVIGANRLKKSTAFPKLISGVFGL